MFSIAAVWPAAAVEAVNSVAARVLFPVYARLANAAPEYLRGELLRARMSLLAVSLPGVWVLALWGPFLIELLYDERYHHAGWMLRLLSLGAVGSVISTSTHGVLLSKGDSFRHMVLQITRGALLISGMALGVWLGGFEGLLIGVAAARVADYPMVAWFMHRYDAWLPMLDFVAYSSSLAVIAIGLWLQASGSVGAP